MGAYTITAELSQLTDLGCENLGRCKLVRASVFSGLEFNNEKFDILCVECSCFTNYSDYLSYYEELFSSLISDCGYPRLYCPEETLRSFASDITRILLHSANTSPVTTAFSLQIQVLPLAAIAPRDVADLSRAIANFLQITILPLTGFATIAPPAAVVFQTASFDEVGPAAKAASLFFLLELFRARGEKEKEDGDRYELHWIPADRNCSICVDDIEKPWDSLALPCSHVFHETCLLIWLEKNHVCPLCQLELPTED